LSFSTSKRSAVARCSVMGGRLGRWLCDHLRAGSSTARLLKKVTDEIFRRRRHSL